MAVESSWKDISVVILGRTIEGIEEVKYKDTTQKEYVFGRGKKPRGIVTGNTEVSGQIVIHQSEYNAMLAAVQAARPGAKLTDVSFDIVASYDNDGVATTDLIVGAEIEEYEKGMAQNDPLMKITLPFKAVDLQEGI